MKRNKSIIIIVILMALISFMCLTFSVSYSYVLRSKSASNTISVQTGNLTSTTAKYQFTAVTSIDAMGDTDGLALPTNKSASLTFSKTSAYPLYYNIMLNPTANNKIPADKIRVALFQGSTKIMGPVALNELPLLSVNGHNAYMLAYGTTAAGSVNAQYYIKSWLVSNISETYDGQLVEVAAEVKADTLISHSLQKISGIVTNSSGTAISGATVEIQHGQLTAASGSGGAYSFSSAVPNGRYNISVTYSGVRYTATINITNGTAVSVASSSTDYNNTSYNNYNIVGIDSISEQSLKLNLKLSGSTLVITKG